MNSSTSTSEHVAWRRLLSRYGVYSVMVGVAIAALLVVSDPYDTGRLTPFDGFNVSAFDQRMAVASVGRLPAATGAILGNSTIQLVDPAELGALTGVDFVSLTFAASGPIENIAVAQYFLRHHPPSSRNEAQVLVFGVDRSWCRDDGLLEPMHPFPFWLIANSDIAYVTGLMQLESFGALGRKLEELTGRLKPPRQDGYHDYDLGQPNRLAAADGDIADTLYVAPTARGDFAAIGQAQMLLANLPATLPVVLVFPPRHISSFPAPESLWGRTEAACKQAFRGLASTRPKTIIVDLLHDDEMARNDDNFLDQIHYRHSLAHTIAAAIAGALTQQLKSQ